MVHVTAVRDSGVEMLDTEVDEMDDDAEVQHVRAESPTDIKVGESAGNDVLVEAQYFVAASIEKDIDDEVTKQMTGEDHVDEASVFVSNEEGEVGGGFIQVDGGNLDDAITELEDDYL